MGTLGVLGVGGLGMEGVLGCGSAFGVGWEEWVGLGEGVVRCICCYDGCWKGVFGCVDRVLGVLRGWFLVSGFSLASYLVLKG